MRTIVSIESALPEPLIQPFRDQVEALRSFVARLGQDAAIPRLEKAMVQVLEQNFGLSKDQAEHLARLAATLPPTDPRKPQLSTVLERCALQRALAATPYGRAVRPYLLVAARAATSAFDLPDDRIMIDDPSRARANIPRMPTVHSQDPTIESGDLAIESPYFKQRGDY